MNTIFYLRDDYTGPAAHDAMIQAVRKRLDWDGVNRSALREYLVNYGHRTPADCDDMSLDQAWMAFATMSDDFPRVQTTPKGKGVFTYEPPAPRGSLRLMTENFSDIEALLKKRGIE